ncbi:MDR family MFS transporter [Saccharibacillus sp. CPCC 101409]|uniref:MDR family MFS transporter n=1 Tax=Saccharibacillus sp. CPCC 101409 TaxID=3058041 RepID=UPI00267171C2|nr:MDR family MFS transporter [Saccharibacillus sp. CPCC 101409]MDO3412366.1 MDR family MFS transporter [Saccharibacillus sp. CPCC 101409]
MYFTSKGCILSIQGTVRTVLYIKKGVYMMSSSAVRNNRAVKPGKEKLDPKMLQTALILVFGALASQLDSTMVNVGLQTLGAELHSTVSAIQWVVTGYILAMGLAVPVSGWAVRRFGGKNVYLFSLVVFLAGSALCSVAWNTGSLIAFRLLQGIGGGLLIPTMQTVLVHTAGGRNLGRIMSIIGIPALLGPILGPVLGGAMIHSLSWRWIFYVNIPVTLAALILAWRIIPRDEASPNKERLDLTGLLLLSPAFAALIYGISRISEAGDSPASTFAPLLLGVLLMAAFIFYALRTKKSPVLDLRLFRIPSFLASNATLFLGGMVMTGTLLLLPLYYQQVRGESVLITGLLLIPQGLGMLATRSWIGGLTDRIGSRPIVLVSLLITALSTVPFAFAGAATSHIVLGAAQFVRGAALNGLLIPIMTSAYNGLSKEQVPHASTSTRILQTVGGAFGSAILATVLDHQMKTGTPSIQTAVHAFDTAFWWSIGFALVAMVPALWLPGGSRTGSRAKAKSEAEVKTRA